jgi:hypothetical protein
VRVPAAVAAVSGVLVARGGPSCPTGERRVADAGHGPVEVTLKPLTPVRWLSVLWEPIGVDVDVMHWDAGVPTFDRTSGGTVADRRASLSRGRPDASLSRSFRCLHADRAQDSLYWMATRSRRSLPHSEAACAYPRGSGPFLAHLPPSRSCSNTELRVCLVEPRLDLKPSADVPMPFQHTILTS